MPAATESELAAPAVVFGDGGDEEPWCFVCLGGLCPHPGQERGHAASSVTTLHGTMLCADCARELRGVRPYIVT